jgi:hypothetical protein
LLCIGCGTKNKERKDGRGDFLQHYEENPEKIIYYIHHTLMRFSRLKLQ